ncbi:Uncharacterized protein AB751O23_AN_00090 [Chlamydiales bacterium SCGC AB-751-O23]|jgi:hypothetical protein|nr:Uncharacterized protein AB751O23_AN_00090 [Chlamydiales bacterium SCGC AB-751-O23]
MENKEIEDDQLDQYSGGEIKEFKDTKVPTFLKITYFTLIAWGLTWFVFYFDGSQGYLDRGYWQELAQAAKTTISSW